ncbi:DUF6660 family protein [Sphingobacterium shayense]|uniref:DUF6660 family protein n=1 Tax=Sphingobacterium shayense TaxID=626343 RepID=UPI001C132916|nr:DUF6660 family protein [Sphingobacterium shayense]
MRVFLAILVIYLQALFLMPCVDTYGQEASFLDNHSKELAHGKDHDHPGLADSCSPFCLCSCCGTVLGGVFYWDVFNFSEIKITELTKPNPQYVSQFVPRYVGDIWQPPKINA